MSSVQFVVFFLGKEEYGLDIYNAQEIIRVPEQITKMPNMPSFIEGMVNLRDKLIPIIDLKKRFGFELTERNIDNRLLVINIDNSLFGIIVDDVSEVVKLEEQSIERLNSEVSGIGGNSLKGIGRIEDRLILLLDTEKLKTEVFKIVN